LRATADINDVTQAHIHLGARGQNGPVVAFLFGLTTPTNFTRGQLIARGVLRDTNVITVERFTASIDDLAERIGQGRAYVNVHTVAHPGGEIRGQLVVTDRESVSHYQNPEFSWRYEVAPAAVGFVKSSALGGSYLGDMLVGAARDTLMGGTLFRFNLRWAGRAHGDQDDQGENDDNDDRRGDRNGDDDDQGDDADNGNEQRFVKENDDNNRGHNRRNRTLVFSDPRLADRVADNLAKFDITESESLLIGTDFGIGTDIETGPNGNLFVVSLSKNTIYEIFRRLPSGKD